MKFFQNGYKFLNMYYRLLSTDLILESSFFGSIVKVFKVLLNSLIILESINILVVIALFY